ncbi:MAG: hypothetical protein WDO68_30170 [Gammaproteobacteria bacterium]
MYLVILITAVAYIALEIYAARRNRTFIKGVPPKSAWATAYRWRFLVGVPFAGVSVFMGYTLPGASEKYRVIGLPFMVAAFDSAGRDYVGPLSLPSLIANAAVWFFAPGVMLWLWSLKAKSAW